MVDLADVLRHVPLASAAVWFALGIWLSKRAFRSAPERAFSAFGFAVGVWAILDWLFRQSRDPATALALARGAASVLPVISLLLLYFARWLTRPRGIVDYLLVLPAAGAILVAWTLFAFPGPILPEGPSVERQPVGVALWSAQIVSYALATNGYLAWSLRRSTFESPGTRRKLEAIMGLLVIGLAIWLYENIRLVPTLSTQSTSPALLAIGIGFFAVVARLTPARIHSFVRKLLVTPARPSVAIWYHKSGQPIAQLMLPGETRLDAEAMGDLARAIDHVVSTGFSAGKGALRELRVGDHVLMFEEGRYLSLFVVIRGSPSAGLRSELRAAIREFEALDGTRLVKWETATELAEPALRFLDQLLRPSFG